MPAIVPFTALFIIKPRKIHLIQREILVRVVNSSFIIIQPETEEWTQITGEWKVYHTLGTVCEYK